MNNLLRIALMLFVLLAGPALAQVTQLPDFTYQGRLQQNGQPANGAFDLTFTLYDAASNGKLTRNSEARTTMPSTPIIKRPARMP